MSQQNKENMDLTTIKTFEDILKLNGLTEEYFTLPGLEPHEIAGRKLALIVKTVNEGWVPDYEDYNQDKYEPRFYKQNGAFVCNGYLYWYGLTYVGSRLCFKNFVVMKYVVTQFIDIYRIYLG